jgi:hypothetical protein
MGIETRGPKEIRVRAGRSRAWVAVQASVSEPTARLYEVDEGAVESDAKRHALAQVYASLEADVRSNSTTRGHAA